MWPYTQEEVTWLALPNEREAAERTQRAIEQRWLREVGVSPKPANDWPASAAACDMRAAGR